VRGLGQKRSEVLKLFLNLFFVNAMANRCQMFFCQKTAMDACDLKEAGCSNKKIIDPLTSCCQQRSSPEVFINIINKISS